MNTQNGAFIVIEGTDGSGKSTQFALLRERLVAEGYDVVTFDFPRYKEASSYFVRQYLAGAYGSADEVGPYTASLFYALDRYEAAPAIREALQAGKVVLVDRFVGSNMAHQGTKFQNLEERHGYFLWLDSLEFVMLGTPRPDRSFVLRVPAEVARQQLDSRARAGQAKDVHEKDDSHIARSVAVYDNMCALFPQDFVRIDCVRSDKLMSKEQIHAQLWEAVTPLLPDKSEPVATSEARHDDTQTEEVPSFTTSQTDSIYAFNGTLQPATIAGLTTAVSRYGGNHRDYITSQLKATGKLDEYHFQKMLKLYVDESVGQLFNTHFVVERGSQLLAKKLEWGRYGSYVEQASHLARYDQKVDGRYKYFVPAYLNDKTKQRYIEIMDKLFANYAHVLERMITHVRQQTATTSPHHANVMLGAFESVRPLLPLAAETSATLYLSAQAQEHLVTRLLHDELPEAWEAGQQLLRHARQANPGYFDSTDKSDRIGTKVAYQASKHRTLRKLQASMLEQNHTAASSEQVKLERYWPRNEIDVVADMMYEHSDSSLANISKQVERLTYDQKTQIYQAYLSRDEHGQLQPGRALEAPHYTWDVICDYDSFKDMQRHRIVDALEWQALSPRFGFSTPDDISAAGLEDTYANSFDLSLELYGLLQEAGYALESQYAVLYGHLLRWKVTINARELVHIVQASRKSQGREGYRRLVDSLLASVATVHPLLAAALETKS